MTGPIHPEAPSPSDAALHEVRVDWRAGRSLGRVYRTPTASLHARLTPAGALMQRLLGPACAVVSLTFDDLASLARVFGVWNEVRDEWAAYYEWHLPPSSNRAQVYWAPGRAATPRTVGRRSPTAAECAGIVFGGKDEFFPLAAPRTRAPGLDVIGEYWRCELGVGPEAGEPIGERWCLDGRLTVDVRRPDARSHHGDDLFLWRSYEADVPAELLALRSTILQDERR